MAITTVNEKLSLISWLQPYNTSLPISSDGIDQADQQQLIAGYAGVLWGSGATYFLEAESGSFILTGNDADLLLSRKLIAESSAFTLTGNDAGLFRNYLLGCESGAFTLTGQDISLFVHLKLLVANGSFALTGNDIIFTYSESTIPVGLVSAVFAGINPGVAFNGTVPEIVFTGACFTITFTN